MKSVLRCFIAVFIGSVAVANTCSVAAQTTRNRSPRFEAVSIKRTPPGGAPGQAVAGRDVEQDELAQMMREMLAERFKLVAHVEKRERPVFALMRANADGRPGPSLRPTTDCSTRESTASADTVRPADTPGSGSRLAPCRQSFGPGRMESTGFSMDGLAFNLSYAAGRKVIDRTGLKGDYEFHQRCRIGRSLGKESI